MHPSKTTKFVDGDKLIKCKRLKVVSACGECRRKKTKCNGERPCAGCIKARVECVYVNNHKSLSNGNPQYHNSHSRITGTTSSPALFSKTGKSVPSYANTSALNATVAHYQPRIIDDKNNASKLTIKPTVQNNTITAPAVDYRYEIGNSNSAYIQSIEERLSTIENILRAMLGSRKHKHLLPNLHQQQQQPRSNATSVPVPMDSPCSNNCCHPSTSDTMSYSCKTAASPSHSTVHAPHNQKRQRAAADEDYYQNEYERRRTSTDNLGGYKRTIQEDSSHGYHGYAYQPQMIPDLTSSSKHPNTTSIKNSDYRLPPLKKTRESSSSPSSTMTAASSRMPTAIRNLLNEDSSSTGNNETGPSGAFSHPHRERLRYAPPTTKTTTNNDATRESEETVAGQAPSSASSSLIASSSSSLASHNQQCYQYSEDSKRTNSQETATTTTASTAAATTTITTTKTQQQHTSAFYRLAPPSSSAFSDGLINNNPATTAAGT